MEIVHCCRVVIFFQSFLTVLAWNEGLIKDFALKLVEARHAVIFGCSEKTLYAISKLLMEESLLVRPVNIKKSFILEGILTRHLVAKTGVILDLDCADHNQVLDKASEYRYFNKSYQWLIVNDSSDDASHILKDVKNIGLNSQIIYANQTLRGYSLYDVYAIGLHLESTLDVRIFAEWSLENGLNLFESLEHVQGIGSRDDFSGLKLRGVTVIDHDNISSKQVDAILSEATKSDGVSIFVKYHYSLVKLLQDRLNFTVEYRITRGWAGRLRSSKYRLGLLGVVKRNEADVAASGIFNRLNRFAELDTIHQSWKFEAAFLFLITADLKPYGNNVSGNFLGPFDKRVWFLIAGTLAFVGVIWKILDVIKNWCKLGIEEHQTLGSISVAVVATVSQQGLEPTPKYLPSRIIIFVLLVFSLIMYNFYTSSVVGGLLSITRQGPKNLEDIVQSSLQLSFEDIGYHKVIFKESNRSLVKRMYVEKVLPKRKSNMLPVYAPVKAAIPFIKRGSYAFHCEVIDAYPEIARLFDANEICDLRTVSGLFETELLNMVVTKRSQYTEIFRIVLHRVREVGLIARALHNHRPEKPKCQASSTIHPVTLNDVIIAYIIIVGGMVIAFSTLIVEMFLHYYGERYTQVFSF